MIGIRYCVHFGPADLTPAAARAKLCRDHMIGGGGGLDGAIGAAAQAEQQGA